MKRVLKYNFLAIALYLLYQVSMIFIKGFFTKNEKQTISTDHFNIHFQQVSSWDANSISDALEKNFARITMDLQAPKHPKVQVYIHPNNEEFSRAVGFNASGVLLHFANIFHRLFKTHYTNIGNTGEKEACFFGGSLPGKKSNISIREICSFIT